MINFPIIRGKLTLIKKVNSAYRGGGTENASKEIEK